MPPRLDTQWETVTLILERGFSHLHLSWVPPGLAEPEVFHPWFNMDGWLLSLMAVNLGQCHLVDNIVHHGMNVHCGVTLHLPPKLVIVLPGMEQLV